MNVIGCFPGKGQQALFQSDGSGLQWKPMQPTRYENSPGSDSLPYSSSSEDDVSPQRPARFTPAEQSSQQRRDEQIGIDSLTSSQQTTETTGTCESGDTTGTSSLPGIPMMGPQRGIQLDDERRRLAAVKEESAEGFEGSPNFTRMPLGVSPTSSVVLKKAAIPEPSPVIWELQAHGDKRRQQLKKEAWQLKRYEHLLNLLKEGLIDQADFQAHKKPIMRYMSETCSEPGKENKELEHDKLVFLKQLKEAECLTTAEYRSAKAPILKRLAGYRIISPTRGKGKAKGGLRAILSKLKGHGLRHHSPPRSGLSTPCGSPPQGAKWTSASNPYFTQSDPNPGGPAPAPNQLRRMSSAGPYPIQLSPLPTTERREVLGGSGSGDASDTPTQDLSGSPPSSIRSPLDWRRGGGVREEPEWTPTMQPLQHGKPAAPQDGARPSTAAHVGSEADSKDQGAFGSEFQVQGEGVGSQLDAPGKMPGSVSLDAGSSSRGTSSGFGSDTSASVSVTGHPPIHVKKGLAGSGVEKKGVPGQARGGTTASQAGLPGAKKASYPSKFLLALHSSGEFGGFTNPFSQPPLSEEYLDSPVVTEKELRSDLESSPEETPETSQPPRQGARLDLFGAQLERKHQAEKITGRSETPMDVDDSRGGAASTGAALDGFGTDVFTAQPPLKAGPPRKLHSVLSFPPSSGKATGRPPSGPDSRPNSPPARAAPPIPRSQTLPSNPQSSKGKEGATGANGIPTEMHVDPRRVIPVAPSLAVRNSVSDQKGTTKINVAKIAINRQSVKGPTTKQPNVWHRLTGQKQATKRLEGGQTEKAGLLDSESEVSSEDELGNPSMPGTRVPQIASEALTGRVPPALAQVRLRAEAPRHLPPPRERTERAPKQAAGPTPSAVRERGAKQQRPSLLRAVMESPVRAAQNGTGSKDGGQGTGAEVGRGLMEQTESEASDEVLFEDEVQDQAVSSSEGAVVGVPMREGGEQGAQGREGHRGRGSGEGDIPNGRLVREARPLGTGADEGRTHPLQRQESQRHDRKPSAQVQGSAEVAEAPPKGAPSNGPPKPSAVAGKLEALQRQASLRQGRKPSREDQPIPKNVGPPAEDAAKPPAPQPSKVPTGRHERKASRDLDVETLAGDASRLRYPEEHAARLERKKSRRVEDAAEAEHDQQGKGREGATEETPARAVVDERQPQPEKVKAPAASKGGGDPDPTAQPNGGSIAALTRVPEPTTKVPAASEAPSVVAPQPQPPATAATSKLADLKARMASMRGGPPKAPPAKPTPTPTASRAPAAPPAVHRVFVETATAPGVEPAPTPVVKALTSPPVSVVKEDASVAPLAAAKPVAEETAPASAPSAKMDVAARVAARMAARAQASRGTAVAPADTPKPSVPPPAASTEAASREAQVESTAVVVPSSGSDTVDKRDFRSLSVPKRSAEGQTAAATDDAGSDGVGRLDRARNFSGPISFSGPLRRDDLGERQALARKAGLRTEPSSPTGEDWNGPFASPPRRPVSQPSSPSRNDRLLAMRRQVSTMGSSVKPPPTTATRAWPSMKRGKDGPAALPRSGSQGGDSGVGSGTKDDTQAFSETLKNTLGRVRMERLAQKATRAVEPERAPAPVSRGIEGALHETSRNTPAATWARGSKGKDSKAVDAASARGVRLSGATWQEEMQAAMQGKYAENISPEKSPSLETAGGLRDSLRNWR